MHVKGPGFNPRHLQGRLAFLKQKGSIAIGTVQKPWVWLPAWSEEHNGFFQVVVVPIWMGLYQNVYNKLQGQQSGAVEACWAHNPEVRRSKLRSARNIFFYGFAKIACWVHSGFKKASPWTGLTGLRGAMVARLTPDQKAACSNHVGVNCLEHFSLPPLLRTQNWKRFAPGEARTHGLQIMRLTRCLLRYRGW